MITKKIDLYEYYKLNRNEANGGYLTICTRTESAEIRRRKRPAVLILPGGGYRLISDREGEPVAIKFVECGYVSFILSYSIKTEYPTPLYEAEMAIGYIRDNAEKFNMDGNQICALGFSAGGHLTGLLATAKTNEAILGRNITDLKPNAVILSYPVVTMGEYTHIGSRDIISGGDPTLFNSLSLEKRVDNAAVPAFIWHTFEDNGVSVENSLMLASSYRKHGVPFALHIFEHGWHGLSVANEEVMEFDHRNAHLRYIGKWVELSCDWLTSRGFQRGSLYEVQD